MKIVSKLLSLHFSIILLFIISIAMAVATFIENDHGTPVARALVYDAWWFELLFIWLALVFIYNFKPFNLFSKSRWPVGLFHLAFIIILLGAGITRYFSNEGMMHIREGTAESSYFTTQHYLQINLEGVDGMTHYHKPMRLIPYNFQPFEKEVNLGDTELTIKFREVIPNAEKIFVSGTDTLLDMSVLVEDQRQDYTIRKGQKVAGSDFVISTAAGDDHSEIVLTRSDTSWKLRSEFPMQVMEMESQFMSTVEADQEVDLRPLTLYQWSGGAFMVRGIYENSRETYARTYEYGEEEERATVVKMEVYDDEGESIGSFYQSIVSINPRWNTLALNKNKVVSLTFGPMERQLPFKLKLDEFVMDRYPGSSSPSGYSSRVTVVDGETRFDYLIYMNNVLDYRGYRFYQASYDTDERGTILSLNQDRPGTLVSYLGYFLLTVGMFFTLFAKGSRFSFLNRTLKSAAKRSATTVMFIGALFLPATVLAYEKVVPFFPDELIVPLEKADEFGRLIVQDSDGRMKPVNTLASEITRKLSGKTYFKVESESGVQRLSPEQFWLGLLLDAEFLSHQPLLHIDPAKSGEIFKELGLSPRNALAFQDFIGENAEYLLYENAELAHLLKPSERTVADNELLKVDERFNIFYAIVMGEFLRLFPDSEDPDYTWYTRNQSSKISVAEDARFANYILDQYIEALRDGIASGDFTKADEIIGYIDLFQREAGKEVYPAETRINAELFYNRAMLANRLFPWFWLVGTLMLFAVIGRVVVERKWLDYAIKTGLVLGWIGLVLFAAHLILRWYIAQYPPWSDGFEMLVFVAWLILLFGLLLAGKSRFTAPLGMLFSGTLLFVSFLDWLNPEITSLVPVLDSYWLKIHVSVIVSGYAPLALAAVIGLLNLLFFTYPALTNRERFLPAIRELNIVSEMSIVLGLFLLTVGTFLGGVWANESWGRYWAWDPKETWALISILVYAAILHLRLFPPLKDALVFNLAALWGFSTIIMTSFGVNYYLSGLHSYAQGDPVPVPLWVYYAVMILAVITLIAMWQYQRFNRDEKKRMVV